MHGQNDRLVTITTVTPEIAVSLLEFNTLNRPLNDQHVHRIARQIISGKWHYNGDTIKISRANDRDILDGQHRLWACIEAKTPIETVVARGIDPEAFATIDTLRKPRSGADVLSLHGVTHHRKTISASLQWLLRWQRKTLLEYRAPSHRIENSDIEQAFLDNPGIMRAAEAVARLRGLTSTSIICFFYFILTNRNPDLAERMVHTLENPAGVSLNDPFYRLRSYLTTEKHKDALMTIALMIKAANASHAGRETKVLKWVNQGSHAEPFPVLDIGRAQVHHR